MAAFTIYMIIEVLNCIHDLVKHTALGTYTKYQNVEILEWLKKSLIYFYFLQNLKIYNQRCLRPRYLGVAILSC